jgi:hypothetical protein
MQMRRNLRGSETCERSEKGANNERKQREMLGWDGEKTCCAAAWQEAEASEEQQCTDKGKRRQARTGAAPKKLPPFGATGIGIGPRSKEHAEGVMAMSDSRGRCVPSIYALPPLN